MKNSFDKALGTIFGGETNPQVSFVSKAYTFDNKDIWGGDVYATYDGERIEFYEVLNEDETKSVGYCELTDISTITVRYCNTEKTTFTDKGGFVIFDIVKR